MWHAVDCRWHQAWVCTVITRFLRGIETLILFKEHTYNSCRVFFFLKTIEPNSEICSHLILFFRTYNGLSHKGNEMQIPLFANYTASLSG